MRFIRIERIIMMLLPLLFAGGFPKAWGDTFILPPNEQHAICGDELLPSKQVCRLDSSEKLNEYEQANIVTFQSLKKAVKLNGMLIPEESLMTLVTTTSPENEFTVEFEPKGELAVYNDSELYLTLHCDKMQ